MFQIFLTELFNTRRIANIVTVATIRTNHAAIPLDEILKYVRNGISAFWKRSSKVDATDTITKMMLSRKSDFIAL